MISSVLVASFCLAVQRAAGQSPAAPATGTFHCSNPGNIDCMAFAVFPVGSQSCGGFFVVVGSSLRWSTANHCGAHHPLFATTRPRLYLPDVHLYTVSCVDSSPRHIVRIHCSLTSDCGDADQFKQPQYIYVRAYCAHRKRWPRPLLHLKIVCESYLLSPGLCWEELTLAVRFGPSASELSTSAGTAAPATEQQFVPPTSTQGVAVWSCDQSGSQCTNSKEVFDEQQGDITAWDFVPSNFADDCHTMDYDIDAEFPQGIVTSVRALCPCGSTHLHAYHQKCLRPSAASRWTSTLH